MSVIWWNRKWFLTTTRKYQKTFLSNRGRICKNSNSNQYLLVETTPEEVYNETQSLGNTNNQTDCDPSNYRISQIFYSAKVKEK